jgi:hypothetical protein
MIMRRFNFKISPEEIPWKDYKIISLLIVAPFSLIVGLFLETVWFFSKSKAALVHFDKAPDNAIIYGFHEDVMTNYITMHLIKKKENHPCIFSGFHGFASYIAFGPGSMGAYKVFRFYYGIKSKPREQIVQYLNSKPSHMFGIFTDAGGPYNKVRKSLISLAIESKRPLVPFRSFYSPCFKLGNSRVPFFSVQGKSIFGKVIPYRDLVSLKENEALNKIQNHIDQIKRE